jgi:hypothetical protein
VAHLLICHFIILSVRSTTLRVRDDARGTCGEPTSGHGGADRRPAEMEIPRPTGNQAGNKDFPGVNLKLLNMFRVVAIMESSYLENYMRFSDSTATRFPNRI